MLSSRCTVVSSVSIVLISGSAEARCPKLEACSEASRAMTGCRKVSVGVEELGIEEMKKVLVG